MPTWRSYLYLLISAPPAMAAFVALLAAAWIGGPLSLFLVGIPLLAAVVPAARGYGAVPRALARDLLGEHVPAPQPRHRRRGFLPWLHAAVTDLDGWRTVAHVVVSFPVTVIGAAAVAASWATAAIMLAYPVIWQLVDPIQTDTAGEVHRSPMQVGGFYLETWPRALAVSAVGLVAMDAALATLAARSGVPVEVDTHVPVRPSPAIETIAYYCVAELLTNVAKHSGARRATVQVRGTAEGLHLRVTDDGAGGARPVEERGLAGLAERVRTVDGRLALSSPEGGPTVATIDLPLGV